MDIWAVLLLPMLLLLTQAADDADKAPVIGVSIEDFIDLDAPPQSSGPREGLVLTSKTGGSGQATDKNLAFGRGDLRPAVGLGPAPPSPQVSNSEVIRPVIRQASVTSDDEDAELSGDGSGSGEGLVEEVETKNNVTVTSQSGNQTEQTTSNQTVETPLDLVKGEGGFEVTDDLKENVTSPINLTVSDVVYTADVWPPVPVMEQTDEDADVERWSPWIRMNDVTEVRVRTCSGGSDVCNGTQAEMRTCDSQSNRCDVMEAVVKVTG